MMERNAQILELGMYLPWPLILLVWLGWDGGFGGNLVHIKNV